MAFSFPLTTSTLQSSVLLPGHKRTSICCGRVCCFKRQEQIFSPQSCCLAPYLSGTLISLATHSNLVFPWFLIYFFPSPWSIVRITFFYAESWKRRLQGLREKGAAHNASTVITMHHSKIAINKGMLSVKYGELLGGHVRLQFSSVSLSFLARKRQVYVSF